MNPEDVDHFLELPALRSVSFQNEEHLELLLAIEFEKHLDRLPVWASFNLPLACITKKRLADIRIFTVISDTAIGDMQITFSVDSASQPRAVSLEFELFLIDGLLKFRWSEASLPE